MWLNVISYVNTIIFTIFITTTILFNFSITDSMMKSFQMITLETNRTKFQNLKSNMGKQYFFYFSKKLVAGTHNVIETKIINVLLITQDVKSILFQWYSGSFFTKNYAVFFLVRSIQVDTNLFSFHKLFSFNSLAKYLTCSIFFKDGLWFM